MCVCVYMYECVFEISVNENQEQTSTDTALKHVIFLTTDIVLHLRIATHVI
jgi:hypothetical protein